MSKEEFESLKGDIEGLDEAWLRYPTIPVDAYAQEAEDLVVAELAGERRRRRVAADDLRLFLRERARARVHPGRRELG